MQEKTSNNVEKEYSALSERKVHTATLFVIRTLKYLITYEYINF